MAFSRLDFLLAARGVGVHDGPLFAVCPYILSARLQEAAKRHARFLEKEFPHVGHRQMLEFVAKAAGFPHWHAFHSQLETIFTEFSPPESGSAKRADDTLFERFVPALPLLVSVQTEIAPSAQQLEGLKKLMGRLLSDLGDKAKIADTLAKLNGADTWDQLIHRRPESSSRPLYSFEVDDHGNGKFVWSAACSQLVEEQDALFQQYEERTKSERLRARDHVARVLLKRPDFFEGWLASGSMYESDGEALAAGLAYEEGVKEGTSLIPRGFKGKISWNEFNNRPYHRLLFNLMRWDAVHGDFDSAARLARRQLRQNPDDDLELCIDLPLYLAIPGNRTGALSSFRKLLKIDRTPNPVLLGKRADAKFLVSLALCSFMLGDIKGGQVFFLRALFDTPALRPIILESRIPEMYDKRWYRSYIPDVDSIWFYLELARLWRPNVRSVERMEAILKSPEVIDEEERMNFVYLGNRLGIARDEAENTAVRLATSHAQQWT